MSDLQPVATWVCKSLGCTELDVPKFSFNAEYVNVKCGACGQPCQRLDVTPTKASS